MSTINDVSKMAGVAPSTVSKVINNYPNVTEKTRKKVLSAIDELRYVPNMMAAALSSKNYNRVAIWININMMKQSIDEVSMQYIHGAFSKGKELGMNLLPIFSPMFEHSEIIDLERYLKSESVTGIIIYGLNKNSDILRKLMEKQEMSFVVVDAPFVDEKISSVMIDHFEGQYQVAKQTIKDEFCKQILYIAGKRDGFVTDMRLAAIKKLKDELSVDLKIRYADFSEKKARRIAFKHGEEADVIVCASDLMAIGVKSALKEMDIFRPVCGFDGIRLMGYAGERMYTCKQDFFNISEVAVLEMQRLISGEKGRSKILNHDIIRMDYTDVIL